MHKVIVKGILSSKNGMNIYRGCTHGCIYCDSRSRCYQMNHDFEDIEVKSNAAKLLEDSLKKKRKKCMIGTGSMTDPYIPLESNLQIMKNCLDIIYKYGFGVTIITKSDLILRDLDILTKINNKAKCVIQTTLTTFDENLCKIIEPNVATTKQRVNVLKTLRDCGIPTIVWLCPILPLINDTIQNLNGILNYCIESKVKGIICFGMGLTLRDGNREYFYNKLDEYFPGIKEKYIKIYRNNYQVLSEKNKELMNLFYKKCKDNNIMCNVNEIFSYLNTFEEKQNNVQLNLFDSLS